MEYPSLLGPLAFQHPIVSIQLSRKVEPRPQTPPEATKPILDAQSTSSPQGSFYHAVSEVFEKLQPCSAAPMIAKNVEKNDKSDVRTMLGFFLGQCATQAPDKDPVLQRRQEADIFARVLNAVIPVCNRRRIKNGVKNYCKEVKVEEDRYRPFVELFNNVLQEIENIKDTGLRDRSLDILFHLNDPSEAKAAHSSMETIQKPDTDVTQLDATKTIVAPEHEDTTREEFTAKIALEQPGVSFSWSDVLAVAEFKLGRKSCLEPPDKYSKQLTKKIPPTENIYGPLRTTSVAKISTPVSNSRSRATPPTQLPNIFEMREQWKEAQQGSQRQAAKKSQKSRDIIINESDKTAKRSPPSARSEQMSVQTDSVDENVPPVVQAALYGTELLCRGSYASHAITLLIQDDVAWIWWFDRQGAIQSAGINFVQDLPYFVVLLVAFQRFDLECWGIIEAFQPHDDSYNSRLFNVEFPDQGLVVSAAPKADIYERYNLMGRCTRVYSTMGAIDGEDLSLSTNDDIGEGLPEMKLALKIYWPEWSRPNEADILEKARELGNSNPAIKDHIPELLAVNNHPYSTGVIRSRLGFELSGQRVLRILLFKFLRPLDPKNLSMGDFMHGWKQCLLCHFHLWKGGIEHGDISLGNLMWNDENKMGVLGDFDLAILRDSPDKRGRERTGKIARNYRHDVESFIWVLVWVFMLHDSTWEGRETWQTSNYTTCRTSKTEFLMVSYSLVSPPEEECLRWRLVGGLLSWLRGFYPHPRIDVPNETVFAEVMEIIKKYWVWGTRDEPVSA